MGKLGKYTPELVKNIHELMSTDDYSNAEVSRIVGINEDTFYVWKKTIPEFAAILADAEKRRMDAFKLAARKGMRRLLEGHEFEETHTEYVPDKDGAPKVKKQKVVKRWMMPNAAAVIFTSKNLDPENFKDIIQQEVSGPGGGAIKHAVGIIDFTKLPAEVLKALLDARQQQQLPAGPAADGGGAAERGGD